MNNELGDSIHKIAARTLELAEEPDYQQFRDVLLQASRMVFVTLQTGHPDEAFYAFGLFHEPLWGYIIPTSNTEEGLMRRAQEYKLDKHNLGYAQMSLEELMVGLRWSPADWAYHNAGKEYFQSVDDWLTENGVHWKYHDDDKMHEELNERMITVCRDVLMTLDTDGIFGTGKIRERVVLNIMMGDQDRSWLAHARVLNPPAVYERWISELKQARLLQR